MDAKAAKGGDDVITPAQLHRAADIASEIENDFMRDVFLTCVAFRIINDGVESRYTSWRVKRSREIYIIREAAK